jgi:hypothetical protein
MNVIALENISFNLVSYFADARRASILHTSEINV